MNESVTAPAGDAESTLRPVAIGVQQASGVLLVVASRSGEAAAGPEVWPVRRTIRN